MWPRWTFDGPQPFFQTVPDQTLTGNQTAAPVDFITRAGDFVLLGLVAQSTGAFSTRIYHKGEGRYLDNGRVRSANLWGSAQYPTFTRAKFFKANSTVSFELTDLSGSTNTIRLYLIGRQASPGDSERYGKNRGFFVMVADPLDVGIVLPGNLSLTQSVQVDSAAHFICDAMTSTQTSSNFLMNLAFRDPRSQFSLNLSNDRMHHDALFGTQNLPFVFQSPAVMAKNSQLLFDGLDKSGSTNTVRPTLVGALSDSDNPADWAA
jgi:hypothetical protein